MSLSDNLQNIKNNVTALEIASHRPLHSVKILAVSKQQSASTIIKAYQLGQLDFGESYAQEALAKITLLKEFPLVWHFIGPIQSNKTSIIAEHFHWVHSVCRIKIAELLSQHRPKSASKLQICIQINLNAEPSKSGLSPEEALPFIRNILPLPRLCIRGLMLIPPKIIIPRQQFELFLSLNKLMQQINKELGLNLDSLSMGMSDDYPEAVKAGSTIIRVGRSFFG